MRQSTIDSVVKTIKFGLYALPFLALVVAGNFYAKILLPGVGGLFFPFITSKAFYFRIIVEILFALWVFVAVFDFRFRPKFSPIFWAVSALFFVLALSTVFSVNPYKSFWSNYERMEGLVGHIHLFLYFLVLTSVFKKFSDWKKFFYISFAVSFLVSSYAYFQSLGLIKVYQSTERVDATMGNSSYLAIYIVFHLFLVLYFLLREEKIWLRNLFGALIIYEAPIVFLTATRGAILGLLGGVFILSLGFAFFSGKMARKISLGIIGLLLVSVMSFWFLKDTNFVRQNYVLRRLADLSLTEQTVRSRFTIWDMSWRGFKERPILGWGIENYDQVFNKYYEPELWRQEPWFDRSHNIIFDWLSHAGILGLAAYLFLFIAGVYVLLRTFLIKDSFIFISLFAAYFFHNLFVFDNLTSYFLFFSVLGFIHFYYYQDRKSDAPVSVGDKLPQTMYMVPSLFLVFTIVFLYFVNIKPLLASRALLQTLAVISSDGRNTDRVLSDFDNVFSYRTFGTGEAREQLVQYINLVLNSDLSQANKIKVAEKAVAELEKQIEKNPESARYYLFLSAIYGNMQRHDDSLKVLEKAIELSPKRQQIYFLVADAHINKKELDKAFEVLKFAYELDKSYPQAAINLAIVSLASGKVDFAEDLLKENFGTNVVADSQLATAYAKLGNLKKVKEIWEAMIKKESDVLEHRIHLAATYLELGERQATVKVLEDAIAVFPDFKQQGEYLINEVKAGRNP